MSGNKRKAESSGGGGKRNKGKYFSGSGKQGGIPLGTRGVLVSCTAGKEHTAAREAISLLTDALECLLPEKAKPAVAPPSSTDISTILDSELAELKDDTKQTFFWHNTGVNSVVYVEIKDQSAPSPGALVVEVCRKAQSSRQCRSRFVNRLYPVESVCFASMEKMDELASDLVGQHFGPGAPPTQYAVQYDHRAAPPLDRMKVIDLFAEKIKEPHKVNLSSPQKTILVNLLKNACGVAVVEEYKQLSKFNIRVLTTPPEDEREGQVDDGKAAHSRLEKDPPFEEVTTAATAQE